jgi:hypothetical protein
VGAEKLSVEWKIVKHVRSFERHCIKAMQEELFPKVARASQKTVNKAAKTFSKKNRIMHIPEGTFVMVRNTARKSKLEPINTGPFKVIKKLRAGTYALEDSEGQLLPHNFPPSALISLSTLPTFDQESFEVEAILKHEETDHGMRYLVRWKNYTPADDSWEAEDNFDDPGAIHEYWSRRGLSDA